MNVADAEEEDCFEIRVVTSRACMFLLTNWGRCSSSVNYFVHVVNLFCWNNNVYPIFCCIKVNKNKGAFLAKSARRPTSVAQSSTWHHQWVKLQHSIESPIIIVSMDKPYHLTRGSEKKGNTWKLNRLSCMEDIALFLSYLRVKTRGGYGVRAEHIGQNTFLKEIENAWKCLCHCTCMYSLWFIYIFIFLLQ